MFKCGFLFRLCFSCQTAVQELNVSSILRIYTICALGWFLYSFILWSTDIKLMIFLCRIIKFSLYDYQWCIFCCRYTYVTTVSVFIVWTVISLYTRLYTPVRGVLAHDRLNSQPRWLASLDTVIKVITTTTFLYFMFIIMYFKIYKNKI